VLTELAEELRKITSMADEGLAEIEAAIREFESTSQAQRLHNAWMAFDKARKGGIDAHRRLLAFLDDWPRA
jgi:hypothetical protein